MYSDKEIITKIKELSPWYHNIRLKDNIWTIEKNKPAIKGDNFKKVLSCIPRNLKGKKVLDLGCNSGFFSFLCKERGADKVVGIDKNSLYIEQAKFCSEVNELNIDFYEMSAFDIEKLNIKFDLVLFLGLLYHLVDIETIMKIISKINTSCLILETATCAKYEKEKDPILLVPIDQAGHRYPNISAVYYFLKEVGKYSKIETIFTGGRSCFVAYKR